MKILAGARKSPLSRVQVTEVERELQAVYGLEVSFEPYWVDTVGDLDKKTSLRTLGKSDFFTRDIDELLLAEKIRVGIHSAKDLPDPIREGLTVAAITQGLDSRDVLVIKSLNQLVPRIATSSERREEAVRQLYPNALFSDLRGTIQERLELIEQGIVDGIVVAEAALIRLGLTSEGARELPDPGSLQALSHLYRIFLPGETAPMQGKLAVLIRAEDEEMKALFRGIDERPLSRDRS